MPAAAAATAAVLNNNMHAVLGGSSRSILQRITVLAAKAAVSTWRSCGC
jgi:hypothetical protein